MEKNNFECIVTVKNINKINEQMQAVEQKLFELKEAVEELDKMNFEVEIS